MKYETPELTALTPAINAIQAIKNAVPFGDTLENHEVSSAYEDWE